MGILYNTSMKLKMTKKEGKRLFRIASKNSLIILRLENTLKSTEVIRESNLVKDQVSKMLRILLKIQC